MDDVTTIGYWRSRSQGVTLPRENAENACVDCSTYNDALRSIDRLNELAAGYGSPCTRPEACAAVFASPDGWPLEAALVNIGAELLDEAAEFMHRRANTQRSTLRAFARAPRF